MTILEMHMVNGEIVPEHTVTFYTAESTVAGELLVLSAAMVGQDLGITWTIPTGIRK